MNNTDTIESLRDFGDRTSSKSNAGWILQNVKQTVADKLHAAAETIQQKAGQNQNSAAASYANTAAGWLNDASEYVRQVDPQQVKSDIQNKVRRNPGQSLLIAAAAGLALGVLLRR